jgi:two-component system cell cycle sensor histidine kinase/response regulator CckA
VRPVVAGAPVVLFALDHSGIFTVHDGHGLAPMSLDAGALVGRPAADLFGGVTVIDALGHTMTGSVAVSRALEGESIQGECEFGDAVFDLRLLPHFEHSGGRVTGVVGVATEITERLRAEKSLGALLEAMSDLVFVHREGRLVYVNPAALRALGLENSDAIVGTMFLDAIHPDDRDALGAHIRPDDRKAGDPQKPHAVRLVRSDGIPRAIEAFSIPILFGGSLATVSIATDVTEREQATQKLLRNDRLTAIGTLAAGAAHEINNPLTYAMINSEHVLRKLRVIAAEASPPDAMGALPTLLDSLVQAIDGMTRIREIVRNLMTFSQGTVESRALVDVRSVLESSIQMALHEIVHRARLVRDLAEVPPVEANEARLGQVFLNLIVNAAQAIPEGDTRRHEVRIATHTDDAGNVVVEVGDNGVGIAPDVIPKIFDPFFTSKGPGEGVGLGLSISLGTVKSLGGDIQVTSSPKHGTLFRVMLPSAKGWRASQGASQHEAAIVERKRMLVIDDDSRVGAALERALSSVAEVEATVDARAVLGRLASGERWDVILCDLLMPETSGMDLYREALRIAPDAAAHIIFMTAGAFTSRARAFLKGVRNPCLEKPLDMGRLRSLIARVGRWQQSN